MIKREMNITPKNVTFYFLGVFILSLGAVAAIVSNLGAGPWDTVSENFRMFAGIPLGVASAIVMSSLILLTVILTKRLELFVLAINTILVSSVIYFWDVFVFNEYRMTVFIDGLPYFIVGLLAIPLGLALIVASHFPAMVFDELTFALMNLFKVKSVAKVRIGLEAAGVTFGIILGLLHDSTLGAVGIGSILMVLLIGPIFSTYLRLLGVTK